MEKQKYVELFKGLTEGLIPFEEEGFIIVVKFDKKSMYTLMELISFKNVKNITPTTTGVTFHSDGFKTYIIYEPNNYQYRFQEPYLREKEAQAPLRFSETVIIDLPKRDRILISKEPYTSYGNFTIEHPEQGNFVYYIYGQDPKEGEKNINNFVGQILNKDLGVPRSILPKVFEILKSNISKFRHFTSD
ncbi:MAG: hypothetical protein NZ853_01975 [Leptospiraceae bacterium]|nr:hypothetical protein [Leptospiraceae bacterium]MDW7976006.1 hypothetical protein [Leptospiraceae bacterium]